MAEHDSFSIGYLKSSEPEEVFLSVTPGLEFGPGILRDGLTQPRMRDPHHVPYVRGARGLGPDPPKSEQFTSDAYLQRAGTWTLYHHLKAFVDAMGDEWLVTGCQSCGDLTMNPWHVAFIGSSHVPELAGKMCSLYTEDDPPEPLSRRTYRALVKWGSDAARVVGKAYEFLDVRFTRAAGTAHVVIDGAARDEFDELLAPLESYNVTAKDIGPLVEFALSGKPIVSEGVEVPLPAAVFKFEDLRHVFNLPQVDCEGSYRGQLVSQINVGEYQMYHNLNERRAALTSPVLIGLDIGSSVSLAWPEVRDVLLKRHFREVTGSLTEPGQFRLFDDKQIEIFFPHNVYPFGALGVTPKGIVCLASGGLSGRVGNTVEGITRIMFDFFGCSDAIVLDEGFDTFQVVNPCEDGVHRYDNAEMLSAALSFTHETIEAEREACGKLGKLGAMDQWELNRDIFKDVREDSARMGGDGADTCRETLIVSPHRSQMRAVLVFATPKNDGVCPSAPEPTG